MTSRCHVVSMGLKQMWPAVARFAINALSRDVLVVVSPPFQRGEKWSILQGDRRGYRIVDFQTLRAADCEFHAVEHLTLLGLGHPVSEVRILSADEATQVMDLKSYREVLSRAPK